MSPSPSTPRQAGDASGRSVPRLGALLALLVCCWSALGVYSMKTLLPHSPLTLPGEDATAMRRVLPQGWSFFTRNAREPWRQVFVRDGDTWVRAADRQMSMDQLFGARRESRKVGAESAWLTEELWGAWAEDCDVDPFECLEAIEIAETVENTYARPTLCGEIAIIEQKFVPFAWRDLGEVVMPSQVMKLRVRCSDAD